ncbi:MAG: hypothetical protein AAGG75_10980 [Bacteroidota bacterium]
MSRRTVMIVVFCLASLMSSGQEKAYFFIGSKQPPGSLFLINMRSGVVKKTVVFGEELTKLKHKGRKTRLDIQRFPIPAPPNETVAEEPTDSLKQDNGIIGIDFFPPSEPTYSEDSVKVGRKWYKIRLFAHYDSPAEARALGNWNTEIIAVEGIGQIFYSDNSMGKNYHVMLSHKNRKKHKVLAAVYRFFKNKKGRYATGHPIPSMPWEQLEQLVQKYSFSAYPAVFTESWTACRTHLQLLSYESESTDNEIRYTVVIKNTGDQTYAFHYPCRIGPAEVVFHYSEKSREYSEPLSFAVLNPSYYYKALDKNSIFIEPEEELKLEVNIAKKMDCKGCSEISYRGFQVHKIYPFDLLHWLMESVIGAEKRQPTAYPFQIIQKID